MCLGLTPDLLNQNLKHLNFHKLPTQGAWRPQQEADAKQVSSFKLVPGFLIPRGASAKTVTAPRTRHPNVLSALWSVFHCYPHFIDEATEMGDDHQLACPRLQSY